MKATWIVIGMGVVLGLTACGEAAAPVPGEEETVSAAPPGDARMEVGAATAYARATRALSDNRMLSPAGDNAVEHYLEARSQASEQVRAQAALAELQPYVVIATEQAIARDDAQEASRLQHLVERIDAQAPALPRLRAEVSSLLRDQAARATAASVATPPAPSAAPSAVTRPPTPPAILATATTTVPEAAPPPVPSASPPMPAAVQEAPRPASVPAPSPRVAQGARTPRLLQDAQPRYPLPALRARIEGQAEVAFTIQPDGSVRDVRLLSSTSDGMFDASALAVAQRWRFEATGQAHASSRTVRFRLPAANAGGG